MSRRFDDFVTEFQNRDPEYQFRPRTMHRDRDLEIARRRGVRRPRRARFVVSFDPVRYALADSLRWVADCLDPRRGWK
jgi:hypothetical protein